MRWENTLLRYIRTRICDYRTFFVGALPAVDEKEPNTDFAVPQQVPMNSTVVGTVENEDVDYFVVEAKKGDRLASIRYAVRPDFV